MGSVNELAVVKAQAPATVIVLRFDGFNREHRDLSAISYRDDRTVFLTEGTLLP